jgi:triosephosphate isomerase
MHSQYALWAFAHATISYMKKSNPLIVGNWKLNPVTQSDATALAAAVVQKTKKIENVHIAIAPPYPYLIPVEKKTNKSTVALCAQDVSTANMGAFTGEVSILQLKDIGTEFVILGHSERRAKGEKDDSIREKMLVRRSAMKKETTCHLSKRSLPVSLMKSPSSR